VITEYGKCRREIECGIAVAKAGFKKKSLLTSKLDLSLRKKPVNCYIWSVALCGVETGILQGSRSETPGKFSNVVPEKDGEYQLDRSCEK
jgi:hypothetical protein